MTGNSGYNSSMSSRFGKKKMLIGIYAVGGVLLVGAACLWCVKVSMNPERVFWNTIAQGLATPGVTIKAEQTTSGRTLQQIVQYSLGGSNMSHLLATLRQGDTIIRNEMIGTPKADYTRYLSIKTDQKKADGGAIDFSSVLGVWARSDTSTQLFSQSVLGTALPLGGMGVPIGNLNPKARADLVRQIRDDKAYAVSFGSVAKKHTNGRTIYTYDVRIEPAAYVALMKRFAQSVGLHDLDQLDPAQYRGQEPVSLKLDIDARAKQVVALTLPDVGYTQTYSGYGLSVQQALPKHTVTGSRLQELLTNLQ